MKTYMPLNGLRWSRNSGSANCDMPQSAVFGRPGGGEHYIAKRLPTKNELVFAVVGNRLIVVGNSNHFKK